MMKKKHMSSSMFSSLQKAENNAVLPERFFKVTLGSLDAGALAVLPKKNCQNFVTILLEPLNVNHEQYHL